MKTSWLTFSRTTLPSINRVSNLTHTLYTSGFTGSSHKIVQNEWSCCLKCYILGINCIFSFIKISCCFWFKGLTQQISMGFISVSYFKITFWEYLPFRLGLITQTFLLLWPSNQNIYICRSYWINSIELGQ